MVMREDFDKQKYAEKNSNIRLTINNYTSLKTEIENLLKKYSSNKKASEVYKKLKTEFTNSKDECMKFITEIIQKCQNFGFDIESEEKEPQTRQRQDSILKQQVIVGKLEDNKKFLEQRNKELKEAQVISSEIKHMAIQMNEQVKKDDENFDIIDKNVDDVEENIAKALSNLKQISKNQKKHRKQLLYLFIAIFVVIIICILLLYFMIWRHN